MIYDTSIPHERAKAETYFNHLLSKKKRVEIKVKHPRRSISQNSYLHLILSAFGMNFGYTLAEVKHEFFKKEVNPEIEARKKAIAEKEEAAANKKEARQKLLDERKQKRLEEREAKKKEYEAKRKKLIEAREAKKKAAEEKRKKREEEKRKKAEERKKKQEEKKQQ